MKQEKEKKKNGKEKITAFHSTKMKRQAHYEKY